MPPVVPAETAIRTITVRAPKGGRRRAGRRWPEGETVVDLAAIGRDALDALAADPSLIVTHGRRLVGEADAGTHPPVGTMERDDLHAVPAGVVVAAPAAPVPGPADAVAPVPAATVAPVPADAVAPVPDSTIPGTQAAVSGAVDPDGTAEIDEAVEAAIRALTPESYGRNGTPVIDAVRSMFAPADRDAVTVQVRDRVWARMTAAGFVAPANSADEPRGS